MKMKTLLLVTIATLGLTASTTAQNLPNYVPSSGIVGWWPFTGNANDESGNGNNGSVNGASLTNDRFGNANGAYYFNGLDNWIQIADSDNLELPNNLSINCWFYANSFDIVSMLISKHSPQCNNNEGTYVYGIWNEGLTGNHKINFSASPNFTSATYPNNQGLVSLNSWYQFVITYDDSLDVLKYYLNGILVDTKNLNFDILNNPFDIFIGKQDCGNQWHFNGKIDDIGIWNRTLTQQEITDLYNANICYQNITVTDTLLINMGITGFNPVTYNNTIKIFPNPTNDHITINYGNFTSLNGYQLKIINSLGQQVFQTNVVQQSDYLNLTTWGGNGLYFLQIIDSQGNIIDIRKIVLQ
jgi:hypothetical protein